MALHGGRSKVRAAPAGAPSNQKMASSGFSRSRSNNFEHPSQVYAAALFAIKQLDTPTPCLSILIVPPCRQNANFAAGQNDGQPDLALAWPDILALDTTIPPAQLRDRCFGSALQVRSTCQQLAGITNNIDAQVRGCGMHQQQIRRPQPAARKQQALGCRVRKPKIPDRDLLAHN